MLYDETVQPSSKPELKRCLRQGAMRLKLGCKLRDMCRTGINIATGKGKHKSFVPFSKRWQTFSWLAPTSKLLATESCSSQLIAGQPSRFSIPDCAGRHASCGRNTSTSSVSRLELTWTWAGFGQSACLATVCLRQALRRRRWRHLSLLCSAGCRNFVCFGQGASLPDPVTSGATAGAGRGQRRRG